ncbi:MAG: hypothetical protein A2X82_03245 [Geobacteraceae bacterium GWC2_55_20]|nr:MAG: hypothetical protein A2X82_03245 [Geobacteraceae bacterium GWC2_55_20]OGU23633.1 MAG: hypothetical protein A2X85_15480 [Geobacteraceae bacterium GWF2_54_21]HBA72590.1 hypothetical protein [Geobacter sp.]HCE67900.1 hypothetical protein [Geobacter sp.]
MSILESIRLGTSTNLVRGYQSDWNPESGRLNILRPTTEIPFESQELKVFDPAGAWSYPEISLHDTSESLLSQVLPYRVVHPSIDTSAPVLPSGPLVLGSGDRLLALDMLSSALGVDLKNPALGYALVRLTRLDGTALHKTLETGVTMTVNALTPDPELGLNGAFMRELARLKHFKQPHLADDVSQLGIQEANTYLDAFKKWGTHYVAKVDVGDQILQVFAFEKSQFARVRKAYENSADKLRGQSAVDFEYFTTDANTGEYGFVKEYGKLLCLSNDQTFIADRKNGEWFEKVWSNKESIFAPFGDNGPITLDRMNREYSASAPIGVELAPLTTFTEYKRSAVWRRVLKGALAAKFGDTVNVNFSICDNRDFTTLLPDDQPGVLSSIATPGIDVFKVRLDIADIQLVARDEVKQFTAYGYVVSGASRETISLPGASVRLFAYVLDMRTVGKPRVLELGDAAFDSLQIGCDTFLGAMLVRNAAGSKRFVVVDGLKYIIDAGSPEGDPLVAADLRVPPPADACGDLKNSLEFSMAFAEAVLGFQTGAEARPVQRFVRGYLDWVTRVIPADSEDEDLAVIRYRALDLGKYAADSRYGSFVPILPASQYEEHVTRILDYITEIQRQIAETTARIDARKQAELTIDVAKTLNQNIIESGKLLSGLITANAAQYNDLVDSYDNVISVRQSEAELQQSQIAGLQKLLFEQQAEVDAATQNYKSKVQQWEAMEAIKFGLDVATNLFSLGTSIALPASSISSVKDLGLMVQRIQKTLNVLNAASKLFTGAKSSIENIRNAQLTLDGLGSDQFGDTAQLSWDEMSIKFDVVMASGPSDPNVNVAKAELGAAFKTLVMRGKALSSAKSQLHQIQRDIYTTQRQKELNERQVTRLNDLQGTLNPREVKELDRSEVDLVGLTGQLDYLRQQMLGTLAKAFLLQDQALQYANLQPPTMIQTFSLMKFRNARVMQQEATIRARSLLASYQASTTTPIEYVVEGVLTDEIINGAAHRIVICPDAREFMQYVNLRVVGVTAAIEGVKGTDSGKLLVRLTFQDAPFSDRDTTRQKLSFHTPWRERTYEYDVASGAPLFSDNGESWSDGVSQVTPFGEWQVDIPRTVTNRGVKFESMTVKIRLSFVLEARIIDAPIDFGRNRKALAYAPHAERLRTVAMTTFALMAAESTQLVLPSVNTLVSQMFSQGSTTNGWDVVFNMSRERINKALCAQYDELKNNTTYKNTIHVTTRTKVVEGVWAIKKFDLEYGYPLLVFTVNNNETVSLEMPIITGSMTNCIQLGEDPEKCDLPVSIQGKTLTANVKLSKMRGSSSINGTDHNLLKVVLDMQVGAFSINEIEISDEEKIELNKVIKAYFVNNPVIFLINQLDLTSVPTIEALRPNEFYFKVLKTPAGNELLQMFIQTGGHVLLNYSQTFLNNIPEPIPQAEECSLIIRSAIFFGSVLPQSLNKNSWRIVGKDPGDPNKAWHGEFTVANVSATGIDLSKLTQRSSYSSGGGGSSTTTVYSFPNNTVTWALDGMILSATAEGPMMLTGVRNQTMTINTVTTTSMYPCLSALWGKDCTTTTHGSFKNDVTSNVSASSPISVVGTGRDQSVSIKMQSQAVTVTGNLSGGGPSGSDDLQAQVNQQIKEQVPSQIVRQLDVSFDPISLFALKNLLFPSNNYIKFSGAYVPGDALIVGTFENI